MVKSKCVEVINKYDRVALAVSGGSDSMAMLHWFLNNVKLSKFCVVNIDHNIRGQISMKDSLFVESFCKKNKIDYFHYDVFAIEYAKENKKTIEESARILRHEIFCDACLKHANVVATAHHMSDQAESILMHIARGTGLDGLIGMQVEDGHLIRPLLKTSKDEIMEYLRINRVEYRTDSTNFDNGYTRNFIRNEVMISLKKKFPTIENSLVKLGERAFEALDFIDENTPQINVENGVIELDLQGVHEAIKTELIKRSFKLLGVERDIEERHILLVKRLINLPRNCKLDLPFNTICYNEYGKLIIALKKDVEDIFLPFEVREYDFCSVFAVDSSFKQISEGISKNGELYLDFDKIPNDSVFRRKKSGDKFNKFGGGNKSLGDYFTDIKYPQRLRSSCVVLASNDQILAIVGVEISKTVAVDMLSKNVVKITKGDIYD